MINTDPNKEIGRRLREARDSAGLSQAELAKALGYESATAVSLIEAGERKFKIEDLQKAAELFHRDIGYFLGHDVLKMDVKVALRADKDLSDEDKKAVLHFIELAKKRHEKK